MFAQSELRQVWAPVNHDCCSEYLQQHTSEDSERPNVSTLDVSVQIQEGFDHLVSEQWLRRIAQDALAVGPAGTEDGASVVIADDEVVRDLNRRHRGLDENTDVLSFSFAHGGGYHGDRPPWPEPNEEIDFVLPPGQHACLGEVIISYPQAERQATCSGHSIEMELAILLVHGVLHLLGYGHEDPEEEAVMKRAEARVLAQVLGKS